VSVPAEVVAKDPGLRRIEALCEGQVSRMADGGRDLLYMEGLRVLVQNKEHKVDALLCLNHTNPTYPTKLYLSQNLGAGLNWNETAYILGRQWYTYSWKDVAANRPLIEILAAHLAALNPPA
jgi:hypothetical protein